jgi:hypothetical protein
MWKVERIFFNGSNFKHSLDFKNKVENEILMKFFLGQNEK